MTTKKTAFPEPSDVAFANKSVAIETPLKPPALSFWYRQFANLTVLGRVPLVRLALPFPTDLPQLCEFRVRFAQYEGPV